MRGDLNSNSGMSAHDCAIREVTLLSIFGKRSNITSEERVTTLGWLDDRLHHVYTQGACAVI